MRFCWQAVVEKSETELSIEAAVVSVDLIKNRRPFRCQHEGCNKTFKNPQTMKMHHKTHYSDGSAGGKGCTLPTLTSSLKAGHNKKTPSRCPKCKKTFVGLYELRRHYGRKHSEGEKPFGCRKCGKKFYIEVPTFMPLLDPSCSASNYLKPDSRLVVLYRIPSKHRHMPDDVAMHGM